MKSVHDTLYFKTKRIKRLLIVIFGRLGLWKFSFYIVNKINDLINNIGKGVKK